MKNKVIAVVIIILLALTGVLIWYAFNREANEDGTIDAFNQENSLENTEGFEFNNLPEPAPTPEEREQQQIEPAADGLNLSAPPAPEPVPSFDGSQIQGEGTIDAPGEFPAGPTSSLIPLFEVAKKKLPQSVG